MMSEEKEENWEVNEYVKLGIIRTIRLVVQKMHLRVR